MEYYYLSDIKRVGKMDNFVPYLYNHEKGGWVVDTENLLMDRLMGYDGTEGDSSPYTIGNSDMLSRVEEITHEEAQKIIEQQ